MRLGAWSARRSRGAGEHPDAEAQRGAEQGNTGLVAPAFSATTATAEQRGDGVELAAQDRGRLVEQDVAQHPAPDAGDRTEERGGHGPETGGYGLGGTG